MKIKYLANSLLWPTLIATTILYTTIHIPPELLPGYWGNILSIFTGVHLLTPIIFSTYFWILRTPFWRMTLIMLGFPLLGILFVVISSWIIEAQGLIITRNGYAPALGYWLFVPYFPILSITICINGIIALFIRSRCKAR